MPAIQLNAKSFEELITRRGMPIKWEQAVRCSCWDGDSGQPMYVCKACNGEGYVYMDPVYESAVLVMALIMNEEFKQGGDWKLGDSVMTVPRRKQVDREFVENPVYDIGMWDRVTLMNTEFRSHELLTRGTSLYGRPADALRNPDVTRILKVSTMDPETGAVQTFEEGQDYTLDQNTLHWKPDADTAPSMGDRYSVLYYHRPVYLVHTQLPQHRDQDGQHFPKKLVLRYRDVI